MGDVIALRRVALVQGSYFLATGIWPLIDIDSFQVVTGPKTDLWLVRTVGVLVGIIGVVLIVAARRTAITREIVLLAVGSALGLAAIDIVYVFAGIISPVYLGDAMAEIALSLWWSVARWRS